jgi:hypothetical protein
MLSSSANGQWELREFRLSQACSGTGTGTGCTLTANNTYVQNNPFGGLFQKSGSGLTTFQSEFIQQVPSLAASSIPLISMSTPNVDNAGESDEQDTSNDYAFQAGLEPGSSEPENKALSKAIQTELTKLQSSLTPQDILNRATTQACAGCHQVSTFGQPSALGGGLTWPASNGFTQIDENGNESTALTKFFLPFRETVLTNFINQNCGDAGVQPQGDGTITVGGTLVGSSN